MEIREPGEVFIDTLLIGPSDASEIEENHDIPDEEDFKDDGSHFTHQIEYHPMTSYLSVWGSPTNTHTLLSRCIVTG